MRFLIIAPYFFPYQNPRAKRAVAFIKALDKAGYKADIISSGTALKPKEFSKNIQVHAQGFNSTKEYLFKGHKTINPNASNLNNKTSGNLYIKSIAKTINQVFLKSLYWPDDAFMWIAPAQKIAQKLCEKQPYDFMLSFSLPFSSHIVAKAIKDKFPNIRWITDIGDPLSFQDLSPINNEFLYKKRNKRIEAQVLNKADLNIVTNTGQKYLYTKEYKTDPSKIALVGPLQSGVILADKKIVTNKISIIYLGSFYNKLRSPQLIIEPFENLLRKYPEYKAILQLTIAGNLDLGQINLFKSSENLKEICTLLTFQGPEEMDKLLEGADFVINLGNQSSHQLPSKCVDYLRSRRPIINIVQSKNDPSVAFFGPYPMLFTLDFLSQESSDLNKLKEFIDQYREKTASINDVQKRLGKHSGQYMLDLILSS